MRMRALTITSLALGAVLAAVGAGVAQTPAPAPMPPGVHVMNGILMDGKGMSLYTFDNDREPNTSSCTGGCLTNWPALEAAEGAKNMGDWTVITREDGKRQWAYKGKPIYYFVQDKAAGDRNGDGRGGVWHLAKP